MYTHQGEATCILKLSTDTAIRNSHQEHKSYLHCKIFALMLPHQNCRWVWNTLAKIKKKSFKFLLKLSYQTKVFQNIGFTPTWVAPIPYLTSFKNFPAKKWCVIFNPTSYEDNCIYTAPINKTSILKIPLKNYTIINRKKMMEVIKYWSC